MWEHGLEPISSGPIFHAARALLEVERRFGFLRDVEGGLFRVRVFQTAGTAPPPLSPALADDLQRRLGIPPVRPAALAHRSLQWSLASMPAVRARLLHDERFGVRSEDDTAWFDPSPEGAAGLAERDARLVALLAALEPASICHLIDDRTRALEDVPMGVVLLWGAGVLVAGARVSLSVQLDTRARARLFADEAD